MPADHPLPRTGVWLYPDAPAGELVEAVVEADAAGIDEVWIADEGVAREPVALLAAAAVRTTRVRLGIGITSPLLRHPGALASSIATVDELSGGRAILGLGVGGHESLAPFGITVQRPIAMMRDAILTARAVLRSEPGEGYAPPAHAAPGRDVPIFLGARGEQMNRLASRRADGVFLSGFDLTALAAPVAWARSERPIHVALYASARFAEPPSSDPTALSGTPETVAGGLHRLVTEHRPDTIGLALVDGRSPQRMMASAIATFAAYHRG
jgi:alkanesulfonate monooxygenase SsuD/methylene tetrahydromethanopterin reductase-like flavin-dependent oxidoreductase (luciferase family)